MGVEPLPVVRLFENHSSSLVAWRAAGVESRIVVHFDGHSDLDWLPDETVARIAAAEPHELSTLELHPYAMDGETMSRFAIWNFVYPAARLGIVRELVWVVPDGTLGTVAASARFAREILVDKLERVGLDEASGLSIAARSVRGEVLGVPVLVCELADLPSFDEAVLLDVDLDFFTTQSATTQEVVDRAWIMPGTFVDALRDKGVRSDLVTLSLSTIGGYFPATNRWIGRDLLARFRSPRDVIDETRGVRERAVRAWAEGRLREARTAFEEIVSARPDDACAWLCLSKVAPERAEEARREAVRLDPVLAHERLFEGDSAWLNGEWDAALVAYRAYLEELPVGPFTGYALRRVAGCSMRLGDTEEAIATFERVLDLAPRHADTLLDLAVLYRERGELDRAVALLERARAILPQRSTYAMALGTTLLVAGRVDEGVEHLEDAVRFKPVSVRARRNLAAGLVELERFDAAGEHVRVALSLAPRDPQLRHLATQVASRTSGLTDR